MSSLHDGWVGQLHLIENDASWGAQIRRRVLRFLLSRYPDAGEEMPLAEFPLYEGGPVRGRAKALLSSREQENRLSHIAHENLEQVKSRDLISNDFFERGAWRGIQRRRRVEAFRAFGQKPPPPLYWSYFVPHWLQYDVPTWGLRILARMLRVRNDSEEALKHLSEFLRLLVRFFR